MSSNIVIAVLGDSTVLNFDLLYPGYRSNTNGCNVYFHRAPSIRYAGDKVLKNFDILLDFEHTSSYRNLLDIGVLNPSSFIHQPRLAKYQQITNLRNKLPADVLLPNVYKSTTGDNEMHAIIEDRVVIKRDNGACGDRQILVDSARSYACLQMKNKSNLKDSFPDDVITDNGDYNSSNSLFDCDTPHVQEYIGNITEEYRILFGGSMIYGYRRTRIGDKFKHANLDFSKPMTNDGKIELIRADRLFTYDHFQIIKKIIKATDLIFGSVDLFFTDKDEMGVFEYQSQFGFYNIHPKLIQDIHESAIDSVILNFLKQ